MKKLLTILFVAALSSASYSQVVITEKFDKYNDGQPVENIKPSTPYAWEKYKTKAGDWIVSPEESKNVGESPKVVSFKLSYPGYDEVEKALDLNPSMQNVGSEAHVTTFRFQENSVAVGDSIYVAFLVNFSEMPNRRGAVDFFSLFRTTQSYINPASTSSSTSRGRLFVSTDAQGNVTVSVSKASQLSTNSSVKFPKTSTALLVLKWKHKSSVSKGPNDEFAIFVNPDLSKGELMNMANLTPARDNEETEGGGDLRQLAFYQNSGKILAKIGAIRVGKSFESIKKTK
jgi:hypothetical protein